MANNTSKFGSPFDAYNPWVIAVGTTASSGQAKRRISRSAAPDPESERRAGQKGILQRFRRMLQRA
ncbi:MAG: hypothetical protein BMS9Abin01_1661 [Gammaproteobacteria bacterium]|nr:MAG: hypothetical protein BMS9Abin01_1661 [Gammaproteobacteria bacterium]